MAAENSLADETVQAGGEAAMQGLKPPKKEQSDRRLVTGNNRGDCVCVFQEVGLPGKEDRRSDSGSGERGSLAGCGERWLRHPSHPSEPFPDEEIRLDRSLPGVSPYSHCSPFSLRQSTLPLPACLSCDSPTVTFGDVLRS